MWKALRKWWRYLGAKLHVMHDELADPKVQLEQAITRARENHRRLMALAANVLANQRRAQQRLDGAVAAHQKMEASARQALLLADREARAGDGDKAEKFEEAAESFANDAVGLERDIHELEQALLESTKAAESAKEAVAQNASALRERLAKREQLLSRLDQVKMREQLAKARDQISATIGDDVPTYEEVERKIDVRSARVDGMDELDKAQQPAVDVYKREVELERRSVEAQARLSVLRSQLGLLVPLPAPNGSDAKALER
jgi:phage shock protein A